MRYIFIIIVALGLIAFNYIKSFNEGDAEALGIEIDSRAVSVLRGTITHVRDGDTFEVKERRYASQPWIALKTAQVQGKSLHDLPSNSKASKLFASSLAQRLMIELLVTVQ